MTLSNFLRDYLYVPLGGSRRGSCAAVRQPASITMLPGRSVARARSWTFVIWGGLHGAFLATNHLWRRTGLRLPGPIAWAITFVAVMSRAGSSSALRSLERAQVILAGNGWAEWLRLVGELPYSIGGNRFRTCILPALAVVVVVPEPAGDHGVARGGATTSMPSPSRSWRGEHPAVRQPVHRSSTSCSDIGMIAPRRADLRSDGAVPLRASWAVVAAINLDRQSVRCAGARRSFDPVVPIRQDNPQRGAASASRSRIESAPRQPLDAARRAAPASWSGMYMDRGARDGASSTRA